MTLIPISRAASLPHVSSYPKYDRGRLGCGIAHLGVGNFHRSHQALYLHELLQQEPSDWMVHGVGCLPPDLGLVEALCAQDGLYTLTERSGSEDRLKVVGALKHIWHAPSRSEEVVALLASKEIRIISLTITEKGYCNTVSGDLDLQHPMIQADLREGGPPVSALGYLYRAAERRMSQGGAQVTMMSCDNLSENGSLLRRMLLQLSEAKDPSVGRWIAENVSFPNCMVDRITPAVTPKTRAFVASTFGIEDACPVVSESYLQWVIEDRFIRGRPPLERVGVQFVPHVEPYEALKVRTLNGSHSALAYTSYLLGHREVHGAMRDPLVEELVRRYMDEDITPTLPPVPGIEVSSYKKTLRQRFANPAVGDQVQRLAMDGSTKVRTFIVPPLEDQLASGGSIRWIAFALAAWLRYLRGVDEQGSPIELDDPRRDLLQATLARQGKDPRAILSIEEIFGARASRDSRLAREVAAHLEAIDGMGTRRALEQALRS